MTFSAAERAAFRDGAPSVLGVSPIDTDTELLATYGCKLAPRTALDMGTGTGFIAIMLARAGVDCTATDINPAALRYARAMAADHGCRIEWIQSDLFEDVRGRYELILFNPPYGHCKSSSSSRWLEFVKSLFPKENLVVRRLAYLLVRSSRRRLLMRFLSAARAHVTEGGSVLILLHERELGLLDGWHTVVLEADREFRLVHLT